MSALKIGNFSRIKMILEMDRSVKLTWNVKESMKNPGFYTFDTFMKIRVGPTRLRAKVNKGKLSNSKMAYFSLNLPNFLVTWAPNDRILI